VTAPAGTFLAKVREGAIRFPPPIKAWCDSQGWDLFQVSQCDPDRLVLEPVLESTSSPVPATDAEPAGAPVNEDEPYLADDFRSSLSSDGRLWIPAELRESVSLMEQSVMMRVENGGIGIYLRKLFDTLGFRP
jgi:hypothetical protein